MALLIPVERSRHHRNGLHCRLTPGALRQRAGHDGLADQRPPPQQGAARREVGAPRRLHGTAEGPARGRVALECEASDVGVVPHDEAAHG